MNYLFATLSDALANLLSGLACLVGLLLGLACIGGAFWLALKEKEGWGWFLFVGLILGMAAIYNLAR